NHVAVIQPETCKACGLCADRCPMDALTLEDNHLAANKKGQAPTLDPALCLGCGVCVHKCPSGSLTLSRKEKTAAPPDTPRDWMMQFMKQKR
ncbi:MAG: 4Fe-4S dicluster domain-containing protein, partial [Desulfobacteraceae bacterium]|nr:4Fe-4S dicluster domain-containing protein [Desulfobacteraceae bacterium]